MTDDRHLDDLETDDETTISVVNSLRAAYVRAELPVVGPALAEVFRSGLVDADPMPAPWPDGDRQGRSQHWRLRSRAGRLVLGLAAVSVNLVGVGSAGLLPGPAQTAFEKAADSAGIELPESTRSTPSPGRSGDGRGTPDRRSGSGRSPATTAAVPGSEDLQGRNEQNRGPDDRARTGLGPSSPPSTMAADRSSTTVAPRDADRDGRSTPCPTPPGPSVPLPPSLPTPTVPLSPEPTDPRLPGLPGIPPPPVPGDDGRCPPATTTPTTTTPPVSRPTGPAVVPRRTSPPPFAGPSA